MSNFTPGPWRPVKKSHFQEVFGNDESDTPVCTLHPKSHLGYADPIHKANARLIASAPDLLDICQEIKEQARVFPDMQLQDFYADMGPKIDAAIAQATGEADHDR